MEECSPQQLIKSTIRVQYRDRSALGLGVKNTAYKRKTQGTTEAEKE